MEQYFHEDFLSIRRIFFFFFEGELCQYAVKGNKIKIMKLKKVTIKLSIFFRKIIPFE